MHLIKKKKKVNVVLRYSYLQLLFVKMGENGIEQLMKD